MNISDVTIFVCGVYIPVCECVMIYLTDSLLFKIELFAPLVVMLILQKAFLEKKKIFSELLEYALTTRNTIYSSKTKKKRKMLNMNLHHDTIISYPSQNGQKMSVTPQPCQ